MIRESKQLQIGKAGEYLVCADLILKGFVCFPSEQGLPYDVLLDNGKKLIKIQVKTTEKPRIIPQRKKQLPAYIFNVKRAGNNGKTRYNKDEIDLFALVCLDTMKIGYLINTEMPETLNIRVDSSYGKYYDEKGLNDYLNCIEVYKTIKNKSEIAKMLNLQQAVVSKYLQNGYTPFKTKAKYFRDFVRNKNWFINL